MTPEERYRGRKPTARTKGEEVRQLAAQGLKPVGAAKRLGISRASVYRQLDRQEAT